MALTTLSHNFLTANTDLSSPRSHAVDTNIQEARTFGAMFYMLL